MREQIRYALSAIYLGMLLLSGALLEAQQVSVSSRQLLVDSPDGAAASTAEVSPTLDPFLAKPALKTAVQLRSGLEALTHILDEYRRSGNRHEQANTLSAIANTYNLLQCQQRSLDYYDSALAIWKEIDDKQGEVTILSNMGDVYREWGFPERAVHFYRESLALYGELPNRASKAATLNDLGVTYLSLHDKNRALEYLNKALVADREIHDQLAEARTISNLGAAYFFLSKDRKTALRRLQDALTKMEMLGDSVDEANTLEIMGLVWRSLNEPQVATSSFQRALVIFRNIGDAQGVNSVQRQLRYLGESPP